MSSSGLKKIASYLPAFPSKVLAGNFTNAVNYLLDSYFYKIDVRYEQAQKAAPPRRWVPDDLGAHVRKTWIGCDLSKCVTLSSSYPSWAVARNSWAFEKLFDGEFPLYNRVPFLETYEFGDLLADSYGWSIRSSVFDIALDTQATLPVNGTYFVECPGSGAHLLIQFDMCYDTMGCSVSVLCAPENKTECETFLSAMANSLIANDIYYKKCLSFDKGALRFERTKTTSWDDIVLCPDIIKLIRSNSVGVLSKIEDLLSIGMCPSRNSILISPPGMAKTTIFRAISNELDGICSVVWCTGQSIQYSDHVRELFEAARGLSPCIVFIEDMDLFGRDRSSSLNSDPRILNEFLACLDGAYENKGVAIMASTNDIASMDEALVNRPGRFDVKIKMPLPDYRDRQEMLRRFLESYQVVFDGTVTKEIWKNTIQATDGLTGAYLKDLAKTMVLFSVSEGRCTDMGGKKMCHINADDMSRSISQIMSNFSIGKAAKKHMEIEADISVSNDG